MSTVLPHRGVHPSIAASAFVAPTATIIGDVHVGEGSSVWFGAIIRGDVMPIRIGEHTSIQDNTLLHATTDWAETHVGSFCTVGHAVVLHGCTIEHHVLVGMGSLVLDGARIGPWCILGAGSLVTSNATIEEGVLALGRPARAVRKLTKEERAQIEASAERYVQHAATYRATTPP